MNRYVVWGCGCLVGLGLQGCADNSDADLTQWMAEQRNGMRPKVEAVAEPKPFSPQAYEDGGALDPFDLKKLRGAFKGEAAAPVVDSSLVTPELNRRKEPLESFPLDTMTMVGSLKRDGKEVVLLKVDQLIYQVGLGSYVGQNFGKITQITETAVTVREIVQDSAGEWIERPAVLQLQEGMK